MAFDTEELIRVRAYHLWEAHGRPEGRDLEFWEQAQQLHTAANRAVEPARKTVEPARKNSRANTQAKSVASGGKRRTSKPSRVFERTIAPG